MDTAGRMASNLAMTRKV